ncbi:MAG TPA: hypothetical protein VJY62_02425 [Bacteroidia bacterium]|nr:hypothetical protein [Bacteroidia bacterium]
MKEKILKVIGYTVAEVFVNEEKSKEFQAVCQEFLKEEICINCPGRFDDAIARLKKLVEPVAITIDFESFDYTIREGSTLMSEFGPRTSENITPDEARIILTNRPALLSVFVKIPKKTKSPAGGKLTDTGEVNPESVTTKTGKQGKTK